MKKLCTLLALAFCFNAGAQCSPPPAPSVAASSTNVCAGGTVTFAINTPVAGFTYSWTESDGSIGSGTSYTVSNIPTAPSPYIVSVTTTSAGCTSTASSINITVNPFPSAPVITAPTGMNNTYCQGSPTALTVNSGTSIAEWYSGSNVLHLGSSYTPPASLPTGTYTYSVIDSSATPTGCVSAPASANTVTLSITVYPAPSAPVLTGSSNAFIECQGVTPAATFTVTPTGTITSVPVWYNGSTNIAIGNTYTPSTATAGTTVYTVYDSSTVTGCTSLSSGSTLTVAVTVNPVPSITVSASSNVICAGSSATLTASGCTSYSWAPSATLNSSTANAVVASPTVSTTYTVYGSAGTCVSTPVALTVIVYPTPTVSFTLVQDAAPHIWDAYPTYTGGTPNYSYNWAWGDGTYSAAAYPSHTYSVAGTYSICVQVIDANGCSSTYCQNDSVYRLANNSPLSTMVYVNVKSSAAGIEQVTGSKNQVTVYPNPASTTLQVSIPGSSGGALTIKMFDIVGNEISPLLISQKAENATIEAGSLSNGVYFISVIGGGQSIVQKVIVQR